MMNRLLIALGSLTTAVIAVVAALAVAGVFDSDSAAGPGDGEQADTAALCVEGVEDCEDTVVVPGDGESDLPISDDIGDTDDGKALAIEAAFAELESMEGPPPGEFDVIEVRAVDWPNACLGVDTPGIACAQVITPGYVVWLDNGLLAYEFHADTNGNVILANLPR
jgi:hypothetical protein